MRISEQALYDRATARVAQARDEHTRAAELTSTGLRVARPWDDAAAAGLVSRHAQDEARAQAIADTAGKASDELALVDDTFGGVLTSLTRAKELAVQLASDTYNASDRRGGAAEVQQLVALMVSQLNVRMGDRFLLGGMRDGAPPFDATGAYLGDDNVRQVEAAPGVLQAASVRADQAFKGVGGGVDVLSAVSALATALSTNDAAGIRAAVGALDTGISQVASQRSRVGAMVNVFDLARSAALLERDGNRTAVQALAEVDIFEAATRFNAAERALEATLSATAKQLQPTLLDRL